MTEVSYSLRPVCSAQWPTGPERGIDGCGQQLGHSLRCAVLSAHPLCKISNPEYHQCAGWPYTTGSTKVIQNTHTLKSTKQKEPYNMICQMSFAFLQNQQLWAWLYSWQVLDFTFARSSCLTLRLTFSARLQVNVIMPASWLASPPISCRLGLSSKGNMSQQQRQIQLQIKQINNKVHPILCSASILVWIEPSCPTSLPSSTSTSFCNC